MTTRTDRIDVHFHVIPPAYREAAAAAGRRPAISSGLPAWTPELALEVMDRNGIATALTSITAPGVHFGDDAAARKLARLCNEYSADLARNHPGRFGGFAVLPLPDVAGSLDEIAYALDTLRLDGILLFTNYAGRFLGDASFDPVMEALDARGCVAFVHPTSHPTTASIAVDVPAFVVEYVFDTTRAATSLIFSRTLDRFPKIRFVLSHAGGTLPFVAWRLAQSPLIDPNRLGSFTPGEVLERIGRFWFDTALSAGPQTFGALQNVAAPERILFGSDWPFAPAPVTRASVESLDRLDLLSAAEKDAIASGNAAALFPRLLTA